MKCKKFPFIIIMILFILLSGCAPTEAVEQPETEHSTIDQLHILYDIDTITVRETAAIYDAEPFQANADSLREALLINEVSSMEENAFGEMYYAQEKAGGLEALQIYQENSASQIYGGFHYSYDEEVNSSDTKDYWDIASILPGHPDNVGQIGMYNANSDYLEKQELKFQSVTDTLHLMNDLFSELSIPQLQLQQIYCLDTITMQEHAAKKMAFEQGLNISEFLLGEENDTAWGTEDEAYLLYYEQVIDGISLVNHMWTEGTRTLATETPIAILYSQRGFEYICMKGMVADLEKEGEYTIISPKEAESAMVAEYQLAALVSDVTVEDMNLNYVVLNDMESFRLVPAYIFCIAVETSTEHPYTEEIVSVKKYQHYVINAINGEQIFTATY